MTSSKFRCIKCNGLPKSMHESVSASVDYPMENGKLLRSKDVSKGLKNSVLSKMSRPLYTGRFELTCGDCNFTWPLDIDVTFEDLFEHFGTTVVETESVD